MSRQQKVLFPKTSPGCFNSPGLFQFPNSTLHHHYYIQDKPPQQIFPKKRKHVLKACDRCRVKKSKCDGNQPCDRCLADNQGCIFRDRKATQEKVHSKGFVEMLISQHNIHLQALHDLYRRCVSREGIPGSSLEDVAHGRPGTYAILDRLGLINHAEEMAEDPQTVLADIMDYSRCLETTSDGINPAGSTEPSEATQSGSLSPKSKTSREIPDVYESSFEDIWNSSAESSHQYQGAGSYKLEPQQYQHDHQCQHQLPNASLGLSGGDFPYQYNAGHLHMLEPGHPQQQRYEPVDSWCQTYGLPRETVGSVLYNHHMPGVLPYDNGEHLMAIDQNSYHGMAQYGLGGYYMTLLGPN